jgi:hypothetical protein
MNASEIEAWCRQGNGGTIGRTLLLPLSYPQVWEPAPLPDELADRRPMPGQALKAARKVMNRVGHTIAVGFALLADRPDEPFAHVFNVKGHQAVDLALAGFEVTCYWAYVPTPEQLAIDSRVLASEAPGADYFADARRETA